MAQYIVDTTDEQDKQIQSYCDAQIPTVNPEEFVNKSLLNSLVNLVDTCKSGVNNIVSDKYEKADDATKAQVDALLGIKE